MAKYLFIAQSDCGDSTREKEFDRWLDEVHIPDILDTPGIIQASRYINTDPENNKRPKYMVIYEIEIEDINKFDAALSQVIKKIESAGRILNILVPERAYPFKTTYYQQVRTYKK
jgi:hypothetical protein